jgi:hypothetical protein
MTNLILAILMCAEIGQAQGQARDRTLGHLP